MKKLSAFFILIFFLGNSFVCNGMRWFGYGGQEEEKKEQNFSVDPQTIPASEDFKLFLQGKKGKDVGNSIDYVWHLSGKEPELLEEEFRNHTKKVRIGGIPGTGRVISGITWGLKKVNVVDTYKEAVDGMMEHHYTVRSIFQRASGLRVLGEKKSKKKNNSLIDLRLITELKKSKKKKAVVDGTTKFCLGKIVSCVSNNGEEIKGEIIEINDRAKYFGVFINSLLTSFKDNHLDWEEFFVGVAHKVYLEKK